MKAAGYGRIVMTTSCRALYPQYVHQGLASYAAAKMAVAGLVNVLAEEDIGFELKKSGTVKSDVASQGITDFREPLTVHIWTPEGTASASTIPRPLINRYIAAVDSEGVISTGHAALEVPDSIYISLYPAEDIDRSPSEFLNTLKATRDNDVLGRFQPDYATEAAEWCHSDRKICFTRYNGKALHRFWSDYKLTKTYNLTYRNCSSSVAYALENALDGVLSGRTESWLTIIRTLTMPELWVAAQLRKRADGLFQGVSQWETDLENSWIIKIPTAIKTMPMMAGRSSFCL
jgi:hypothetical protein